MKIKQLLPFFYLIFLMCNNSIHAQGINFYDVNNKTGNLQFYKKKTALVSILSSTKKKRNVQIGYSPFNHFSMSAAYIGKNKTTIDSTVSQAKGEFVYSVGGYYFLPIKSKSRLNSKWSKKINKVFKNETGILLNVKTGFSRSEIEHVLSGNEAFSKVNYRTLFLQLGCYLKLKYGQIGMTIILNRLKYKTIEISGSTFPEKLDSEITTHFGRESVYKPTTVNVEGQFGLKAIKFIYGATFTDGNFLNSKILGQGEAYVYGGLLFEIGGKEKNNDPELKN